MLFAYLCQLFVSLFKSHSFFEAECRFGIPWFFILKHSTFGHLSMNRGGGDQSKHAWPFLAKAFSQRGSNLKLVLEPNEPESSCVHPSMDISDTGQKKVRQKISPHSIHMCTKKFSPTAKDTIVPKTCTIPRITHIIRICFFLLYY